MVERVARAITNPEIWDEALLKFYGDLWMNKAQVKARADARAAIEAMREPTRAMEDAAVSGHWEDTSPYTVWLAMIDEALK